MPSQPLLHLLFGEAASEILTISPRLELWSNAFSAWLDWIQSTRRPASRQRALFSWQLLLDFLLCPPWEINAEAIERWLVHLLSLGHSQGTLKTYQSPVSSFYRYCNRERLLEADPLFGKQRKQFNPVSEANHSGKVTQPAEFYGAAYILRPFEARALLRAIDRPSSILGKRDYAFLLTLLLTGLDEGRFRLVQWGSVRQSPHGVELLLPDMTFNKTTHPLLAHPLPQPAWDAILDYLSASGRLPGMQAEDYIFCPLAYPVLRQAADSPEEKRRWVNADWSQRQDWLNDRPISTGQLYIILITYATWAGLDTSRLTFSSLRHASSVFLLQAGADDLDLQSFQGRSSRTNNHHYLASLGKMLARRGKRSPNPILSGWLVLPPNTPCLPRDRLSSPNQPGQAAQATPGKITPVPPRKKVGAQPGNLNGLTHGYTYDGLLPGDRELLPFLFEDEKAIAQKGALSQMMEFLKQFSTLPTPVIPGKRSANSDEEFEFTPLAELMAQADPGDEIPELYQKAGTQEMDQQSGQQARLLAKQLEGRLADRQPKLPADDPDMLRAEIIRLRLLFYRALRLTKETGSLPIMLRAVDRSGLAVGKMIKLRRRLYPNLYPRPKKKKPGRWNRTRPKLKI